MDYGDMLEFSPYELDKEKKTSILTRRLKALTTLHRNSCPEYDRILDSMNFDENKADSYEDLPFLPVRLFKELELRSVAKEEVVKTMTSSGTSGQKVSKIFLDKTTSSNQQKTMVKIVSDFTGSARMPMIIIDCPSVIKDRTKFSARGAGILGFSIFGAKKIYALNDEMQLDMESLREFLDKYKGQRILLFGFTFMIWQHFYKELVRHYEATGEKLDLSNAIMIHGGGWKKLVSEAVSPQEFHDSLKGVCGLDRIHDYYGMVEQTGCIYMQCGCGHLHASVFSDVIIRNPLDFSVNPIGEKGIIQVVSAIPESYPGHSLLTEDEGVILGEDDCPCGRKGKYFKIFGRLKNAEIRGCSDTYAADRGGQIERSGRINYLVGDAETLRNSPKVNSLEIFDDRIIEFCNALSKKLMGSREAKVFPDVVTLGFWLRRASADRLRERFVDGGNDGYIRLGRGVAFHIAPSNVPINFAYSLFTGLFTGNVNIVRVPSKAFPQVDIICSVINDTLKDYEELRQYIILVRYDRDREINDYLSSLCDTRIIWGGDATIAELRKSPLPPRSAEVTFADRYSLAVIDTAVYLADENKHRVAQDFYNDTYLSDQNACTSPRAVVWIGKTEDIEAAKALFWSELHKLVEYQYNFQQIQGVDKLSEFCLSAVNCVEEKPELIKPEDNLIVRVKVDLLTDRLMDYRGNSGFFYEYDIAVNEPGSDINDARACNFNGNAGLVKSALEKICDNVHCQTIGIIGEKELLLPLLKSGIKGIDRVVPIGHTMDFDLVWDGYNLVDRLSKYVVI